MATKSENTRVSTDVLNEARVYCKMTGRILQRFIDDAIKHELKRVKPSSNLGVTAEEELNNLVNAIKNDDSIEKGEGW